MISDDDAGGKLIHVATPFNAQAQKGKQRVAKG